MVGRFEGTAPAYRSRQRDRVHARLWRSSALSTIALAGTAVHANADSQDLWQPQVRAIVGADERGAKAAIEGFMPLKQTAESVFYLDLRVNHDFDNGTGADIGFGVRHIVNPDLMVGGYGYLGVRNVGGNRFTGATLGLEAITTNFDAHVNVHIPIDGDGAQQSVTSSLSLVSNQLIEQIAILDRRDYAAWGIEGEIGVQAPIDLPDGHGLRLHFGGYHFADPENSSLSVTGAKAGFEYSIGDVFGNGQGASLTFGGEVRHDDRDDTNFAGTIRLSMPLNGPEPQGDADDEAYEPVSVVSEGLRKRLNERVRGDIGIYVGTEDNSTTTSRVAINPNTNSEYGLFFFADGGNSLGLGTIGDPTTLNDAITQAGASGFVVALGGAGNIATPGATLLAGQTMIGGGQSVTASLIGGGIGTFSFGGSDGTIQGSNPAANVVTLANGNVLNGVTITGGLDGIVGNNITGATLTNVTVSGAGGNGATFSGTTTGVNASNFTATGNGGSGLQIAGDGTYSFTGTTTLSGNGVDGFNANGNGTYAFQILNTLNNTDDGIDITSVSGNFSTTGGAVAGNGDQGVKIDPIALNVVLNSISHVGGSVGVQLDDITGSFTVTGATTISDTSGAGISISNSAATISFSGGTALTNLGGDGVSITDNTGTISFLATTEITNPGSGSAAVDIEGSSGAVAFTDLGIALQVANTTGFDLSGATVTGAVTATDFDLTSASDSGTVGVNLAGAAGGSQVRLGDSNAAGASASIGGAGGNPLGPETGVLFSSLTSLNFTFGDGETSDVLSTITALTPIDATDSLPMGGSYNFLDVTLNGDTTNLSTDVDVYYVDINDDGLNDGSRTNPGTIAGAMAAVGVEAIILLDTSGSDIIDIADLAQGGGATTLTLDNGQRLYSFNGGDTINVGGGAPGSFLLTGIDVGTLTNPYAGINAAPILTTSAIGANTITLGNNNLLEGVVVANAGGGATVVGTGTTGLTIVDSQIGDLALTNAGGTTTITDSSLAGLSLNNVSGTATITNSTLTHVAIAGGSVNLTGSNADITNGAAVATVSVSGGHTGTVGFDALSTILGSNGPGLRFDNADGSYTFSGTTTLTGGAAIDIFGGSGGSFSFGASTSITNAAGIAFRIDGSAPSSVTYGGTISQNVATTAVSITGMTGGTATFNGNIVANTGAANAIVLTGNTGASVSFLGGLNIDTTTGTGFTATGGGSVTVADTSGDESIVSTAGIALNLANVTAAVIFDSLAASGGSSGVVLNAVAGTFSVTGTTTVSSATGAGIAISGSSGSITFGTTEVTLSAAAGAAGIKFTGTNSDVSFGATSIESLGAGANQTGIDFSGSETTADFGLTEITGNDNASSRGIDLSSTIGNRTISFLTGSSIAGAGIGVDLSSSQTSATSANADFVFGDGEFADANGRNSTITAASGNFTVNTIGLAATGDYDFDDVTFDGIANLAAAPGAVTLVSQDGGFVEAFDLDNGNLSEDVLTISLADANDMTTATTFAFVGAINLAGTTFTLDAGQSITGFGNSNTVSAGTVQPTNVHGDLGSLGGPNITGIAAVVTGTADFIQLFGNNNIRHTTFDFSGAAGSVFVVDGGAPLFNNGGGIDIEGVTVQNVGIGQTAFEITSLAGDLSIANNNINVAGQLFDISGGSGTISVARGTLPNGGPVGTLTGGGISIDGLTGGFVTFSDQVTIAGGGVAISGGSGGAVNFNGGLDITTSIATGLSLSGASTLNVANVASTTINATGQTALSLQGTIGSVTFDSVSSSNAASNGITLQNLAGTLAINGGTISNAAGDGVLIETSSADVTVSGLVIDTPGQSGIHIVDPDGGSTTINTTTISGVTGGTVIPYYGPTAFPDSAIFFDVRTGGSSGSVFVTDGSYESEGSAFFAQPFLASPDTGTFEIGISGGTFASLAPAIYIDAQQAAPGDLTINSFGGFSTGSTAYQATGVYVTGAVFNVATAGGAINIGSTSNRSVDGLVINEASGVLNISDLNVFVDSSGATGLWAVNSAPTSFDLGIAGGQIDVIGGAAIALARLDADITLTSVDASGAGYGIWLDEVGAGAIDFGDVDLSGVILAGVKVENSLGATLDFASLNIGLGDNDAIGLDLSGAAINANITAGDFDVDGGVGNSLTGTLGIDLADTTSGANVIQLGDTDNTSPASPTSRIVNVVNGVRFSDSTNAQFVFGDGEAPAAESQIFTSGLAIVSVDTTLPAAGHYDFHDVDFGASDVSNLASINLYYINSVGTGDGSFDNPGSVANAISSSTANVFVLIDKAGGSDTGTITSASTFLLKDGQVLISFNSTDGAINVNDLGFSAATGAPASFDFTDIQNSPIITAPGGLEAARPTLTNTGPGAAIELPTIAISGPITAGVQNVSVVDTGGGAGIAVNASSASTFVLRNNDIAAGGRAIDFSTSGGPIADTLVALIDGNTLRSNGTALAASFAGQNISATANSIAIRSFAGNAVTNGALGTGGGIQFTNVRFDADGLGGVVNAGTFNVGQSSARVQGVGLGFASTSGTLNLGTLSVFNNNGTGLLVDAKGPPATTFTLNSSGGAVDTTNGTALYLDPLTVNMTLSSVTASGGVNGIVFDQVAGTFTVSGATSIIGTSGVGLSSINTNTGTFNFNGSVSIDNDAVGNGGGIGWASGTLNIAGTTTIGTTSGTGLAATGGTIALTGSGNTIATTTGRIAVLSGVGIGSGNVNFASLTATGTVSGGDAISFDNVDGNAFNGGAVSINSVSGAGVDGMSFTNGSSSAFNFTTATIGATTAGNGILASGTGIGAINFSGAVSVSGTTGGHAINLSTLSNAFTTGTGGTILVTGAARAVDISGASAANVTIGSALTSSTSTTNLVSVAGHTGGTVNFSGNLTHGTSGTNATTTAISVGSNSGGTVNFSGGSKSFFTSTAAAVNLATNTGATINFTGGGLVINTTSGTGFNATGGGTVTVQGTGNTITSTSGTALNIANTTIGAANVTFQSISANGAANGVVLNNTGSSGGLVVTGDGGSSNNGSGGTIQNTTGAGILLANTQNVSFDQLNLTSTAGSGVQGTIVTNFSYTNSTFTSTGNAFNESGIAFNDSDNQNTGVGDTGQGVGNNINGTLTVTGNTFTNPFYSALDVQSNAGTVSYANVSNNVVTNPGFSGVNLVGTGTATTAFSLNDADISNNNISSSGGNGIQVSIGNGATGSTATARAGFVTIDGSGRPVSDPTHIISITGNLVTLDSTGTQAIVVANTTADGGTPRTQTNFEILNNGTVANPLNGSSLGTVILVGNNGNSDMAGVVSGNIIDANHTPNLGGGNGIAGGNGVGGGGNAWTPRLSLIVTNNDISDTDGSGILLVGRSTSGEFYLKIANNVVDAPINVGGSARPGIRVDAGNSSSADDEIYLNIFGNTSAGSNGAEGIGVRKEGLVSATVNDFGIYDAGGGPALANNPTNAQVEAFIEALNPAGGGAFVINGDLFTRDVTLAPPLLAAPGGVDALGEDLWGDVLTGDTLDNLIAAAIERWAATGLTDEQLAALNAVTFEIADLGGSYLGLADGSHIRLDDDGAGYGWYVDATPLDDDEFANRTGETQLYADGTQAPAGQYDLLTTIMHELGHVMGLADTYAVDQSQTLMYGWLQTGERRSPSAIYAPANGYYSVVLAE